LSDFVSPCWIILQTEWFGSFVFVVTILKNPSCSYSKNSLFLFLFFDLDSQRSGSVHIPTSRRSSQRLEQLPECHDPPGHGHHNGRNSRYSMYAWIIHPFVIILPCNLKWAVIKYWLVTGFMHFLPAYLINRQYFCGKCLKPNICGYNVMFVSTMYLF